VLAPARPNGLGVVWVVSSNGISSREQTLQPSFEQRISPVLARGYTVFAVIHGSSPAFRFFPPTDLMNVGEASQNVVDLMRQRSGTVDPSFQFYDIDVKTGARTLVTERERVLRVLRETSPLTHVSADDPPTILIHGDQDKAVPLQQSRRLADRLNQTGVTARLVVREGKGHAWPGWESDTALIADWFDIHLRPGR
jgi:acetyl esterase/lipase